MKFAILPDRYFKQTKTNKFPNKPRGWSQDSLTPKRVKISPLPPNLRIFPNSFLTADLEFYLQTTTSRTQRRYSLYPRVQNFPNPTLLTYHTIQNLSLDGSLYHFRRIPHRSERLTLEPQELELTSRSYLLSLLHLVTTKYFSSGPGS